MHHKTASREITTTKDGLGARGSGSEELLDLALGDVRRDCEPVRLNSRSSRGTSIWETGISRKNGELRLGGRVECLQQLRDGGGARGDERLARELLCCFTLQLALELI